MPLHIKKTILRAARQINCNLNCWYDTFNIKREAAVKKMIIISIMMILYAATTIQCSQEEQSYWIEQKEEGDIEETTPLEVYATKEETKEAIQEQEEPEPAAGIKRPIIEYQLPEIPEFTQPETTQDEPLPKQEEAPLIVVIPKQEQEQETDVPLAPAGIQKQITPSPPPSISEKPKQTPLSRSGIATPLMKKKPDQPRTRTTGANNVRLKGILDNLLTLLAAQKEVLSNPPAYTQLSPRESASIAALEKSQQALQPSPEAEAIVQQYNAQKQKQSEIGRSIQAIREQAMDRKNAWYESENKRYTTLLSKFVTTLALPLLSIADKRKYVIQFFEIYLPQYKEDPTIIPDNIVTLLFGKNIDSSRMKSQLAKEGRLTSVAPRE